MSKPWEKYARPDQQPATHRAQVEVEPATVLDWQTAPRGPCIHCGRPVDRLNGLRNWFGELVHLRCPEERA